MSDESKKFNFEDFLKIYPPITPKMDKSNYKTFSNFFKRKEKEEKKVEIQKNEEINSNLLSKVIDEKEELINDNEINKKRYEASEEDWYLINKGIDLQNKKRKRTSDIREALGCFFIQSNLINKLSKYFQEFQSELISPKESSKKSQNESPRRKEKKTTIKSLLKLPSFIKDKEVEEKILHKINGIINKLTESVKIIKFEENKYIIRMFEIGEQCYFLLSGRLSVLKPVEYKNLKISYENYFKYLVNLHFNKEYDLIEQLIQINRQYVNIHYLDNLLTFVKSYFIVKLNEDIKNSEEITLAYIDKKLNDFHLSYESYGLKRAELSYQIAQIRYTSSPKKSKLNSQIKTYLLSAFRPTEDDTFLMNQYKFVFDKQYEKEHSCSLFKYEIFICLFPGAFFGDMDLDNKSRKRNASIRTEEDCIILSLSNETYSNLLSDDSRRLKALDVAFLCNNFFFVNISPVIFDKYYFEFFKSVNKQKYDIIYQQGNDMDTVYLLKEGEVKFEILCSVLDLYNIIKNHIYTIEKNNQFFKLDEKDIKKLKDTYLNDAFYFNLRNKNNAFTEQLKLEKKMFVCLCNTYECIGLIEYFLNSHYSMSCYVNSIEAKLFEINKYNLEKIIVGEKHITSNYHQYVCQKLLSQIKRLNNIKEDYIKQIENKIREKVYDETKNMKYYIRGQVGVTKPYIKEKIEIKPRLYDDNLLDKKSNTIIFNNPNFKLNKEMYYTKTEANIMPVINNNKRNNNYTNQNILIRNTKFIFTNKEINKHINNSIRIIKGKKEIPKSLNNKYKSHNLNSILNDIKKNTFSKTIVNCGRKFLSLRQIKNKLRNLALEYECDHMDTEGNNYKSITNNINIVENNKNTLNKKDFDLKISNFRYNLLDTGNILKTSKNYYVNPYFSYNLSTKNGTKNSFNTSNTSSNRKTFWKIKQLNNYDNIINNKTESKLINTVLIQSISTESKEKNNSIKKSKFINDDSIILKQTRNFRDF